ncbi:7723_t:CDS:2 [Diversispora eburnea]|uniref:7723_t:CDS:1 n=1 Tax=Diversispora eburnea TaxID=1213867 RepID=A0A9N9B2S2_9GLOM|nr:7723_t:CDS:2 [Diversispora eburnea]
MPIIASREIDQKEGQDSVFIGMASSGRMPLLEKCYEKRIIILLLIAPSWILLYSLIPVLFKLRQGIGADIYRFIEPIVTIPVNYFILISAEVFTDFNNEATIAGAILITWSHLFAYRKQLHYAIHSNFLVPLWFLGGILNGILLSFTAINIQHGTLVGLIYVIIMGSLLAIYLRVSSKGLFSKGKKLVLQSYLISYIVGLILIIVWIIVVRGFKDRKSAGWFV